MAFVDYIWIVKLFIELLKVLARLDPEDRVAVGDLARSMHV